MEKFVTFSFFAFLPNVISGGIVRLQVFWSAYEVDVEARAGL